MNNKSMKKTVFGGMIWSFLERFFAQFITFGVSIVLARLLEPDDYGVITLVTVFITISDVFLVNGIPTALIQKKNADDLDFSSVLLLNMSVSVVLYAIIYAMAPIVANFYGMDILSSVLRVLGISILVSGFNAVQRAYVSKHMLFKRFFWSTLVGTVISAVIGIFMAVQGLGVWALVAQTIINKTIDMIVLWFTVKWRPKLMFSGERVKVLFRFGWKIVVSNLIYTVYDELRNLIIGKKYTSSDLAYFSKGRHYPQLIIINIQATISTVLFPVISSIQDDLDRVKSMTRRSMKMSTFLIFPMMFGMAMIADELILLMLTEKWLPCVPYMQICCGYLALMPLQTANLETLKALGRSDIYMKLEIVKRSISLLILLLVMNHGVMAIASSLTVTGIICTVINAWPTKRLIHYSYMQQICDLLPNVCNTAIMCICIYFVGYLPLHTLEGLLLKILVGVISYVGVSWITRNESMTYLFGILKKKREK